MENITAWMTELNRNNHLGFAVLTVLTMAGIGTIIALAAELVFRALGVKTDKIEMKH